MTPVPRGDPQDAFDLVIPSLPGWVFHSGAADRMGLGRTTAAFADLMAQLGYSRYGTHGGDIGAGVSGRLGATDAAHVVGTLVVTDPGSLGLAGEAVSDPDHLTEEERARVEQERTAWRAERGYLDLQGHRPETIAAALTDSPVGQLAWIVEKFQTWTNPASKTPDEAVDRDQLLTNVSIYWFPGAVLARPVPVRGRALGPGLDCPVWRTERLGGVQHRTHHAALHGPAAPDGVLERAHRGRTFRGHGRAGAADRGPSRFLPQPALTTL